MLKRRQQEIKSKGFNLVGYQEENEDPFVPIDFSKMRVGLRTVNDISLNLGSYQKVNSKYGDKKYVLEAISKHDYKTLADISRYFYQSSGIYYRLCKYLASLYRYDWYVTPYAVDVSKENKNKLLKDFSKVLLYLDKSEIKRLCGNIALDVVIEGVYYGIIVDFGDRFSIQKLPGIYCRSRYFSGVEPVVELNLQFFDNYFTNPQYKLKVLKTFPQEVQKAYVLYKEGKLKGDYPGEKSCWIALDSNITIKMNLNNSDFPSLVNVIPSIIDLDQAQELDRQKTMQQLLKIIIQKLPLDKNGDLIFDVDEARDIHNNAVTMLKRAIGIDVLTTFAEVEMMDAKDRNSSVTTDDLERVERTVYNNAGVSGNIFNSEGNLAVTNSILSDEASMRDFPLMFGSLINKVIEKFSRANHYEFRATMLETTQFNYKEMSKYFKEHAQLGYSKMLPQLALGLSQSNVLATLTFENEVLNLAEIMVPPRSSNTMSSKDLSTSNNNGRPEKEDSEKSDKTIQNIESQA